jgi:hypothetical protein
MELRARSLERVVDRNEDVSNRLDGSDRRLGALSEQGGQDRSGVGTPDRSLAH